jgi:hypothetical protein
LRSLVKRFSSTSRKMSITETITCVISLVDETRRRANS